MWRPSHAPRLDPRPFNRLVKGSTVDRRISTIPGIKPMDGFRRWRESRNHQRLQQSGRIVAVVYAPL